MNERMNRKVTVDACFLEATQSHPRNQMLFYREREEEKIQVTSGSSGSVNFTVN
jgi:hypothetical protein